MTTPNWIVQKRVLTCINCQQQDGCVARWQIYAPAPQCPLGVLPSAGDEIATRAWPSGAAPVSGCCDSAENYLSQYPSV
jgi:hypothetical protein